MNLHRMLTLMERHAHRVLLKKHEPSLTPMYHIIPAVGQHLIIGCNWKDTDEKLIALEFIKQKAIECHATQIGFISEVWMVKYDNPSPDLLVDPPSESPNRVECVLAVATDGFETMSKSWRIIRDKPGGKIVKLSLEDIPTNINMAGRMIDGLLPPRSIH
jgi:hypothetical protein